jgi:tetratricopeptide (TPR) repeat protein
MKREMAYICALFFAAMFFASFSVHAQPVNPQETLKQYVADLQKNPNDTALRERIIKHVQTMRPAPAIPEEAKKRLNRGMAAAESAKTENDYKDAIEEFRKAVTIAPWLGIGYRNLAVMQDKAGQYAQALQNLRLFLLTSPPAADAEAAKTLMDKIEYRQEKAAKESGPQAIAAKKQNEFGDWLKKLDGTRFTLKLQDSESAILRIIDIKGTTLIRSDMWLKHPYSPEKNGKLEQKFSADIKGPEFTVVRDMAEGPTKMTFTISKSGNTITCVSQGKFGPGVDIYHRE